MGSAVMAHRDINLPTPRVTFHGKKLPSEGFRRRHCIAHLMQEDGKFFAARPEGNAVLSFGEAARLIAVCCSGAGAVDSVGSSGACDSGC